MLVEINNGLVKIETRKMFNKGVENISLKNAKDIMSLFNKEQGTRIDTDVINIDLFDETKAFEYDIDGNPVIHCGSFCDYKILFYTVKEYARRAHNSNVTYVYFEIDDNSIEGSFIIKDNSLKFFDISPDEINLENIDIENIDYIF